MLFSRESKQIDRAMQGNIKRLVSISEMLSNRRFVCPRHSIDTLVKENESHLETIEFEHKSWIAYMDLYQAGLPNKHPKNDSMLILILWQPQP